MPRAGRPTGRDVDLLSLQGRGVGLVGYLSGVRGRWVRFTDDLVETTGQADTRSSSFLDGVRHDAATVVNRLLSHVGAGEHGRAA